MVPATVKLPPITALPPIYIFFVTPIPPLTTNAPVLLDVASVLFVNVVIPLIVNPVNVPKEVMLVCDAFITVPYIPVPTYKFLAMPTPPLIINAPDEVDDESVVDDNVVNPVTVRLLKFPRDVILGCDPVCSIPYKLVAVNDVIPLIDELVSSTNAFDGNPVPGVIPDV